MDTTNGAARAPDGTFWMVPERQFYADGRTRRSRERLIELVVEFDRLFTFAKNADLHIALRAIRAARRRLDAIEHEAVAVARGHMWSWRDIGEALGLSTSAVHKHFGRENVPPRRRNG
jgi:DNA-directed RNA polymerase specialized sigma24 family protein